MLTHKNLVTAAIARAHELEDGSDIVLLFLPLAHSFGRLAHQAAAYYGSTVALVADVDARRRGARRRCGRRSSPRVPRIYEKIHAGVLGEIESATGLEARARALGARRRRAREPRSAAMRPRRVRSASRCRSALADKLVFAKVQASGSAAACASASPARRRSASTCSSSSTRSACS